MPAPFDHERLKVYQPAVPRGLVNGGIAAEGKKQLLEIVAMIAGLIARFSGEGRVEEDMGVYGEAEARE